MRPVVFPAVFFLAFFGWAPAEEPSGGNGSPLKLPPELITLNDQFLKAQAGQVTAPYRADVERLDAAYLSSLDRALASAEARVAAIGEDAELRAAENRRGDDSAYYHISVIQDQKELMKALTPSNIGRTLPKFLNDLHATYVNAHAELLAARLERLKSLGARLEAGLKTMEASFAQSRREQDVETVRAYRRIVTESLSPRVTEPSPLPSTQRKPTTLNPAEVLALQSGFTNSLGMKFVPVPGTSVLFCIHETRLRDYAAHATEVPYARASRGIRIGMAADAYLSWFHRFEADESRFGWEDLRVDGYAPEERRADHPVTRIRWDQMQAFCNWLSRKEDRTYRLPTDREWSQAVGVAEKEKWSEGMDPSEVKEDLDTFPWGTVWPPPASSGNYWNQTGVQNNPGSTRIQSLNGYEDGFPTTAPVMSFAPNPFGLFDMGGNVWEAVEDWWSGPNQRGKRSRVWRGGSWDTSYRGDMISSKRSALGDTASGYSNGFRVVLSLRGD